MFFCANIAADHELFVVRYGTYYSRPPISSLSGEKFYNYIVLLYSRAILGRVCIP